MKNLQKAGIILISILLASCSTTTQPSCNATPAAPTTEKACCMKKCTKKSHCPKEHCEKDAKKACCKKQSS